MVYLFKHALLALVAMVLSGCANVALPPEAPSDLLRA